MADQTSTNARRGVPAGAVLIIGLGRFGGSLARTLVGLGTEVLALDHDARLVQSHASEIPHVAQADATDLTALRQLGAHQYDTAVVAIGARWTSFGRSLGVVGGDAYKIMSLSRRLPGQTMPVSVSLVLDHLAGLVAVALRRASRPPTRGGQDGRAPVQACIVCKESQRESLLDFHLFSVFSGHKN